ncbi:hypothetical protein G6F46_004663 [Rhizopus delemar]|uniref:Uncharacterized protein n=2 Tax=Rhizopus TaxID=4842 RepID=A0A9P6Z462_9FUNG|nr:hypothetical protein G6F55_004354 [Rhizopus delemar]KAG1546586.1 hypothetical protein G6F51_004796 [Rhizopus arrhizus]KAG1498399.1 hypothetical protein G6F54_005112 [Rhizopus delemar]KAG1513774.1 hypothetical protein G6F53_004183 [Rhizopus delemar]KAG1522960.1 hypothetical protein G6F52_005413 [Rhizopus delemar]
MAIHKVNLKTWTEQGCVVIGFARKSINPHVKDDIRVKNIQTMIEIFREKSGADIISSLQQCSGDTQDMLKNIRVQNAPVVIVCLTYAGFTTDLNILKEFIRGHNNITCIVIDDYANKNQFRVHSRVEILNKPCIAETFIGQRSK